MDVLADLLERSRAHGAAFAHSTVHGDWGIGIGERSGLTVHAVLAGDARLVTATGDEVVLEQGDVVLVRGELPHRLAATTNSPSQPLAQFLAAAAVPGSSRRFVAGAASATAPPGAVLLCGAYRFSGDLCSSLLATIPGLIRVRPDPGADLRLVLELLAREMRRDSPGQQTVLDRLLDVVLVAMLRDHLARADANAPAWFRALDDPGVGPALRAVHADPARAWTVAALARTTGLSRAAFARRFAAGVGRPPQEYLTDWRMALARERLRDGDESLARVGAAVGYASEFSFAAAFKREHGEPPGRWRERARHTHAA